MLISEPTIKQLSALNRPPVRPLVICDVDEVVVHFLRHFEDYVTDHGLVFEAENHNWGANLRYSGSGGIASHEDGMRVIEAFFDTQTLHMEPINGAIESLLSLSKEADIVMLTNLPHSAGDMRRENLRRHGLNFPVITNSGPKGPAIAKLSEETEHPVIFIDDSPGFVQSSHEHAPHVHIVHFLQDERVAPNIPVFDFVSLRTGSWVEALPHVQQLIRAPLGV
jgi:hypothetical protein